MLSPDYLDHCTDDILRLYEQLDDDIIRDIVRRLVDTDFEMTQSAVWQAEKIQEIGNTVYSDVLNRISDITGKSEDELRTLFEDAGTETMVYDYSVYRRAGLNPLPVMQSPGMLQVLTAGYKKCGESLHNLTLTTANTSQAAYIQACNRAYMQVSSGAFDYNTSIRKAVEELSKDGTHILYPSGHTDRIDVAVRRSVLTGVSQTCGQLQIMRMDEMECDLVETTAHMGARPTHAVWQGRVFSRSGKGKYPDFISSTGYGSGDGLMGWNCRHNFYPFYEGISNRAYTDDELKKLNEKRVTYNGDKYTDYEASQVQRKMERDIRETKRTLTGIDEARKNAPEEALKKGFSEDFGVQSIRLKQQEAKLSDFLAQTGRAEDRSRVQVAGFGRIVSQKSAQTNRKLTNIEQGSIMNKTSIAEVRDLHYVGKIDQSIYTCITKDIKSDEVIITDERIRHIKNRHPNDYEKYYNYMRQIIEKPDFIIEANKANTALILKSFYDGNEQFKTILRLITSSENSNFKNSIITFMKINEKEWNRLIKNKKVLYKAE